MSDRTVTGHNRAIGVLLLIAIAVLFILGYKVNPVSGSTYTTNESEVYQEFGGTIRNTGSGWYVLDDAGHTPDDMTMGTVTSTYVQVLFPTCTEITSVNVTVDNYYASTWHLVIGPSVGFDRMNLTGSVKDGSDTGTAPDAFNPLVHYGTTDGNIWISGRCKVGV